MVLDEARAAAPTISGSMSIAPSPWSS